MSECDSCGKPIFAWYELEEGYCEKCMKEITYEDMMGIGRHIERQLGDPFK